MKPMKLLLDTHILLWAAADKLPEKARDLIANIDNQLFFSTASIWEIAIKRGLKRMDFKVDTGMLYHALLENGYQELQVTGSHVLFLEVLPEIHRDPFDRLMVAQVMAEKMTLLTADEKLRDYPCDKIVVLR